MYGISFTEIFRQADYATAEIEEHGPFQPYSFVDQITKLMLEFNTAGQARLAEKATEEDI